MIPDEAVEAAARVTYDISFGFGWESEGEGYKADLRETVRAALEAAAPQLMERVSTVTELDALPAGSVVMGYDAFGEQLVSRKSEYGTWDQAGTDDGWQAEGIIREYGTVTVLHRGKRPGA